MLILFRNNGFGWKQGVPVLVLDFLEQSACPVCLQAGGGVS